MTIHLALFYTIPKDYAIFFYNYFVQCSKDCLLKLEYTSLT